MEGSELAYALATFLLAGILALLGYLLRRRSNTATSTKNDLSVPDTSSPVDAFEINEQAVVGGSKRQAKNKKRRDVQQEFVHSWLIGSFKGHSAPVLDMDFSANGKYLASCAEDCEPKTPNGECIMEESQEQMIGMARSPPSPTASANDRSAECASPLRSSLSRRQRKNRKLRFFREEAGTSESSVPGVPVIELSPALGYGTQLSELPKQNKPHKQHNPHNSHKPHKPLKSHKTHKTHKSLGSGRSGDDTASTAGILKRVRRLADATVVAALRSYVLPMGQLAYLGFPIEFEPGYHTSTAVILNHQIPPSAIRYYQLDANAQEFVPSSRQLEPDSGNASAGSSLENSDLEQEASGSDSASDSDKASDAGEPRFAVWESRDAVERRCSRCAKTYYVSRKTGDIIIEDKCLYHWGRLGQKNVWSCCKNRDGSRGCSSGRVHVWTGVVPGYNGPFPEYVRTRPAPYVASDENYGVYAIDAEMCFTRRGLELARLTLVSLNGRVVYETFVKPDCEILDYNTRFSGLRPRHLAKVSKSLRDVQRDLLEFVHAETILIGHAVNNDLRALRLLHSKVIDTSIVYPHHMGYPFKHSLKMLTRTLLCREIQQGEHDSAEDARGALDLMLRQVQFDLKL